MLNFLNFSCSILCLLLLLAANGTKVNAADEGGGGQGPIFANGTTVISPTKQLQKGGGGPTIEMGIATVGIPTPIPSMPHPRPVRQYGQYGQYGGQQQAGGPQPYTGAVPGGSYAGRGAASGGGYAPGGGGGGYGFGAAGAMPFAHTGSGPQFSGAGGGFNYRQPFGHAAAARARSWWRRAY